MIIRDPLGLLIALAVWSFVGYLSYWNIKDNIKREKQEDYEPF